MQVYLLLGCVEFAVLRAVVARCVRLVPAPQREWEKAQLTRPPGSIAWLATIAIMMATSQPWTHGLSPGVQQELVKSNATKGAGMYALTFVIAMIRFIYCSTKEASERKAEAANAKRGEFADEDAGFVGDASLALDSLPSVPSIAQQQPPSSSGSGNAAAVAATSATGAGAGGGKKKRPPVSGQA